MPKTAWNLWERLEHFPPILVRLLARSPYGNPLTTNDIALVSGLNPVIIEQISYETDWSNVSVLNWKLFMRGCRCDLTKRKDFHRIAAYLRGKIENGQRTPPSFKYLKRNPLWKGYYQPLLIRYQKSLLRLGR